MSKSKLARGVSSYFQNRDGHIAVVTALLGIPLLLGVSIALDLGAASTKRANIAAGIDAAALAAVVPANLTDQERVAFAKKAFTENYFGDAKVDLDVTAVRERVDIVATTQVPTLLSSIIGKDSIDVRESASAIVTVSDVICVLVLDPISSGALEFAGKSKFVAPACSVQVNSTSTTSMISTSSTTPQALSFCTAGTSRGSYNGTLKNACSPIADPYANLGTPADGPCVSNGKIKNGGVDNKVTLYPGTYCKGLDIKGVDVTFAPGTYIIPKGKLRFRKGSQSVGKGVTFIVKEKVPFWMEDGASLKLTAPSSGTYAGIALFQPSGGKIAGPKSRIRSGSGVSVTGTVYMPSTRLEVSSDSPVISEAPATSFIAYNILFSGEANVKVNVDHEKGGIPPQLPRSDEGARLVQ